MAFQGGLKTAYRRLDIGCGSVPAGDVNVDLLIQDDDRNLNAVPPCENFVKAAAEALPFQDDVFIEVYSSHLLEHTPDPDVCLKEMLRVASCQVRVILPFWPFGFLSDFVRGPKYLKWARDHHKRRYGADPLKMGPWRFRFLNLAAMLRGEKVFSGLLRFPVPFDTETIIYKGRSHG